MYLNFVLNQSISDHFSFYSKWKGIYSLHLILILENQTYVKTTKSFNGFNLLITEKKKTKNFKYFYLTLLKYSLLQGGISKAFWTSVGHKSY